MFAVAVHAGSLRVDVLPARPKHRWDAGVAKWRIVG
jgi:hypothetical protein